jgi:hypothetical protein
MAEQKIVRSVGVPPASNLPQDVRKVQLLLRNVRPPLFMPVLPSGSMDRNTLSAITEYQRRFMKKPDGRIDPEGTTLMRLNWEPVVDQDINTAKQWLNIVIIRLHRSGDTDMKGKLKNVFHIDFDARNEATHLQALFSKYQSLLLSFTQYVPRDLHPKANLFMAWVVKNDPTGTIHFPRNYFDRSVDSRVERLIHERAHTIFNIDHSGMAGAGEVSFAQHPDDDNGFTYQQSMANAYCFGWFAAALQPGYRREAEDIITVPSAGR